MKENKLYFTNKIYSIIVPIHLDKVVDVELIRKRKENYVKREILRQERIKEMTEFDNKMDSLFKQFDKMFGHTQEIMKSIYL